ncbi:MAG: hypothetical protein R2991_13025 [Thermoanaerobaculia bacterium]
MNHTAAIEQLERDLRQLHVDFNRYFAGGLDLPPETFRDQIGRRIRRLRAQGVSGVAERFRLNAVTDRFNALSELFNRRLREEQEGPTRATGDGETVPDVRNGVLIEGRLPQHTARALYDAVYAGREQPRSGFPGFRDHLLGQIETIQIRTGCRGVKLRVEHDEDRPRLKAQPIYEEER